MLYLAPHEAVDDCIGVPAVEDQLTAHPAFLCEAEHIERLVELAHWRGYNYIQAVQVVLPHDLQDLLSNCRYINCVPPV